MRYWWLCAFLLAAGAAAQEYPVFSSEFTVHNHLLEENFDIAMPDFGCPQGEWVSPAVDTFRFREPMEESQCAELRTALILPPDSEDIRSIRIQFYANRIIETSVSPVRPVVQEVRIYDAQDSTTPVQARQIYPSDAPNQLEQEAHRASFNISGMEQVYLSFFVQELRLPAGISDSGLPGAIPVPGQSFLGTIHGVDYQYTLRDTGLSADHQHDSVDGGDDIQRGIAAVFIPGARHSLNMTLHPSWLVESVRSPDGEINIGDLKISSDGRLQTITLSESLVAEHGEGVYKFNLRGRTQLETNGFMILTVGVIAFIPIVAGTVAVRGATSMWREAKGAGLGSIRTMQALLLVLGGIYVGMWLWVLLSPGWRMVVAWPLLEEAAVVYAVMIMTSVVFLILGLRWRRVLHNAIRSDLAEKQSIMDELRRSNQELEQFAYVASHDLQEPLRMVSSYTDLLKRRFSGKFGEEGDQYIQFAREGSQRMAQLINDLLQFSRISTHGAQFTEVDLNEVMGDIRKNLEIALEDANGTFTCGRMPVILGDRTQLLRLFQNLAHNALKFHAEGRPPVVHISAAREGGYWVIRVSDNGIGIGQKYFDKIFVIFQRLHARSEYQGTGLGLALVKRIAERHGGTIWVTSKEGKGATFHVKLPELGQPQTLSN